MTATVEPKDVHPEDVLPGELPDDLSDKESGSGVHTPTSKAPLASRQTAYNIVTGPVTDALYHVLGIRKRNGQDLDEVATQPSVYDTAQAEFYQPRADWEVCHLYAFLLSMRDLQCRTLSNSILISGGLGRKRIRRFGRLIERSSHGSLSCSSVSVSHLFSWEGLQLTMQMSSDLI